MRDKARDEGVDAGNIEGDQEYTEPVTTAFELIKRQSETMREYWSARDLSKVLGYADYRNFVRVIRKAELACQLSGQEVGDHFVGVTDMVGIGSGAKRKVSYVYTASGATK